MIVALDGPAGSGKSTVAKHLSQRLGIGYIDSGAIYRTMALFGMRRFGGCLGNERKIAEFFRGRPQELGIVYENDSQKMVLQGEEVAAEIRTPEVTGQVRHIADSVECREIANGMLRRLSAKLSFVIDGRDIGTTVFPNAPFKFYLDARAEIRAARRAKDFGLPEEGEAFRHLLRDMRTRDAEDAARKVGPLAVAADAVVIDTSDLDIDGVVDRIGKEMKRCDRESL